jgi:hypothetical protein
MKRVLIGAVIAFTLGASHAAADNWPQWRGPSLNGVSAETGLPLRWSKTDNVAWKLKMPARSASTPVVWGDQVFLSVADSADLFLWAVDRTRGTVQWKQRLGSGNTRMQKQNMSTPSPVTDGTYVWVMTGTGILKAFDMGGKEVWSRDIQRDYGRFGLNWGYGSSPLLYEDSLYVQVLHGMTTDAPSYLLRIGKADGRTLWRVERPTRARNESPDAYTTPALWRYAGATEIVLAGGDVVTGHDPASGRA